MATVVWGLWGRCFPRVWLCRRVGPCGGRHYRAALCTALKQPLAIEEVAPRPVRPHEVRVDVHFCGVNFADILVCRGQYQERPHLPFTPEFLEMWIQWPVIAAAGSDEKCKLALQRGAQSSVNYSQGSLKEAVRKLVGRGGVDVVIDTAVWRIPERVLLREAAALPVSYGTAIMALEHRACTQPGESVLVTAAAGATGLAVIDVATNVLQAKKPQGGQIKDVPRMRFPSHGTKRLCFPNPSVAFSRSQVNDAFLHVTERKSTGKVLITLK
ncbi:PREDICTED: quinone oxidoreductase-like protein 2 [Hipposideros armiger]|uniref:Quinone oxidoreductase-like protein 2 n=1 Tax=Hipposideros armiger TaxID=186990 RepID=A0A8B7RND3_HIPAR|nr:PREDICTED: quinone oxidoreductase-like protein 2 [Hipposideros armiger]